MKEILFCLSVLAGFWAISVVIFFACLARDMMREDHENHYDPH